MQSLTKLHDVLTNINVVTDSLTVQTRPDPTVRINRYIFKTFKSFFPRYYINQAHELTPVVPHASGSWPHSLLCFCTCALQGPVGKYAYIHVSWKAKG